jgi:uncharacterized membrane protein YbhN (UPF0104 family)
MKLSPKHKQVTLVSVQVAVSILLLYLLFRNVDLVQAQQILSTTNLSILSTSIVFFILSSFAIGFALHSALKATDATPSFGTTQLANFGGQLLSDVTPAKSGYFATPVLLNQLKAVPIEKGLMSVMAVGAGNFFVKAVISTTALVYFIYRIPADVMNPTITNALIVGIAILVVCGVGLAVLVWTNYFSGLLEKLCRLPFIGRVIKKLQEIRTLFAGDKAALRKSIATIVISVLGSVLFSGISLYLLAQAIGMTEPTFTDLLFMGPLTAAFMYVPITFAGLGLQEAAYVFLLTGISSSPEAMLPFAVTFAMLVRLIAVTTDLVGLPPLLKTSSGLLRLNPQRSNREGNPKKAQGEKIQ